MSEPSPYELARRVEALERGTVLKVVYERDMKELRAGIADIKRGTNRLIALVVTETIALLVAMVLLLLRQVMEGQVPL